MIFGMMIDLEILFTTVSTPGHDLIGQGHRLITYMLKVKSYMLKFSRSQFLNPLIHLNYVWYHIGPKLYSASFPPLDMTYRLRKF